MPLDLAGNNLGTARELNFNSTNQTFTDWVGTADTDDYYRFTTGNRSSFILSLNNLSANADVQLIKDNNNNGKFDSGEQFTGSYAKSITAESIATNIESGTYFIRVYRSGNTSETNYNMSVWTTPDFAGDAITTARNIAVNSTTSSFPDWVGKADTNDYYRFALSENRSLALTLNGLSADADVELLRLNSDGTNSSVAISRNRGTANEAININSLSAGNYLARVSRYSGDTYYSLNLSATPLDYTGNDITAARDFRFDNSSIREWVGNADTDDYFRFILGDNSSLAVTVDNLSADANVQLLRLNGDGTTATMASSTNIGSASETFNVGGLSSGRYFVRVYQGSGDSFYNLNISTSYIASDWFGQSIADTGILNLARIAADGNFNRNDMMAILGDAKDDSVVDANELIDLRTIVANASIFNADYVRVLSNKVVNGDVANRNYQGGALGNLYAGSSDTQMEKLISKWFVGSDRPTTSTSYTYQYTSGSLFKDGISASDVKQGQVGDCYFLGTLASVANEQSQHIQNMFVDNGDDTFTVRFYKNGVADYVTVDRYLPKAWWGYAYANASDELWVALAEKAYAQINESGWIGQDGTNSYAGIEGGWMSAVTEQVTGIKSAWNNQSAMTKTQLINMVNSNQILTAASFASSTQAEPYNLVVSHAYAVTSYDSATGKFHLNNPWGTMHTDLTWEEMLGLNFSFVWSVA